MDQTTKDLTIQKLGTLMYANAELAAENLRLTQACIERDKRIAELEEAKDAPPPARKGANKLIENGART